MVLLDTNVIAELMKTDGDLKVQSWLNGIPVTQVFTSAISKAEVEYGIMILPKGKNKRKLTEMANKVFDLFGDRALSFAADSASQFAVIKSDRKKAGRPISYADAQIAAIAIQYGLQLATRNTKDFQFIKGLEVINPWES